MHWKLVAVVAEARSRRPWAARERLAAAAVPLARQTGESNVHWTVSAPTNVMPHALYPHLFRPAAPVDSTVTAPRERPSHRLLSSALDAVVHGQDGGARRALCDDWRADDSPGGYFTST